MSSAHSPRRGSNSDSSMPHWPCFLNLRRLPMSTADSFWMNAKRTLFVKESGSFWPSSSFSLGLGSKRSICDGAPSMKMKMHRLAFGAKCGAFGAKGLAGWPSAASNPFSRNIDASATKPSPLAVDVRKSRRVTLMMSSGFMSFSRYKFIEVHQRPGHCDESRRFRCSVPEARLYFVEFHQTIEFGLCGAPRQDCGKHAPHFLFRTRFGQSRYAASERLRALEEHGIVHESEGLQRGVRALSSRAGHIRVRRVEGHQHRVWQCPLEKSV